MTVSIAHTATNLQLVAEYWPALAALRDPTAHAPRTPGIITHTQRAHLDYQARQERDERDEAAPGAHRDAARPEILDLLARITTDAARMAEAVSRRIPSPWQRPDPHTTALADPRAYLAWIIDHLAEVPAGAERDFVTDTAADLVAATTRALCLDLDGQVLKAVCPWCHGGLVGDYSLRVRLLPGGLPVIVCESAWPCEPPRRKVGTWWRGRPCWPFHHWRGLARELHRADGKTAA